jgi:hypothetical protein
MPYLLLSAYPVLWIALYALAWRAMSRGATGIAFAISSIPVLVCVCGAGLYWTGLGSAATDASKASESARAQIEPLNPLLWTVRSAGGPSVPVDQALKAIEANPALVNLPVPPYGTPLKNALLNLAVNIDGTLGNDKREMPHRQQDLIRIVRSLVAHGARLSPEERVDLWRTWQLRRALFDGPVDTASENPLVWRIVKRSRGPFTIGEDERPLLNIPTRLHGTPVYAALLTNGFYIFPDLIQAGARLSPEEEQDPAAAKALDEMFQKLPELRTVYGQK